MALETVANYITEVRALMQDEVAPYRYSDASIVSALNVAIGDAYRIRPDMWLNYYDTTLPSYSAGTPTATVDIPQGYRQAFVYFCVAYCQLRDQEDVQDARSSVFLNKFTSQLMTLPS